MGIFNINWRRTTGPIRQAPGNPSTPWTFSPIGMSGGIPTATSWTLSGPGSGTVGVTSTDFTATPVGGIYTGTFTITPSGGGLSTPIVLRFSGSSTPQMFTITPTTFGPVTLTPTNSGGLPDPSGLVYSSIAYSAKFNVLTSDFVSTWTPFTGFDQAQYYTQGTTLGTETIDTYPGVPVQISAWWHGQTGRTQYARYRLYLENSSTPFITLILDQIVQPDAAAVLAGLPIVDGTDPIDGDPNATDDAIPTPASVPYVILWEGSPAGNWIRVVLDKQLDSDSSTFLIADNFLVRSVSPLRPSIVPYAQVGPSAQLILCRMLHVSGRPAIVTAVDGGNLPTISVNGGAAIPLTNPVWDLPDPNTYLPYVLFPLGFTILPTDIVTLSCISSWCTTVDGPSGPGVDLPVGNFAGGNILPAPPMAVMKAGVNLSHPENMMVTSFSDLIRGLGDWTNQFGFADPTITTDAAGNITSIGTASRAQCPVVGGGNQEGDSSQTYLQCRPGVYTLIYATGSVYELNGNGAPTTITGPTENGDGTTTTVYNFGQTAPHFGPIIDLFCTTPGVLLHIYPPDPVSPLTRSLDGTAKFHPDFLDKIADFQCLRHMDSGRINNSNVVDFVHFNVVTNLSYSRQSNDKIVAHIVQIDPYTDSDNKYAGQGGVLILVTTSAPHLIATNGAQSGILAGFSPDGFATVSPTGTTDLNGYSTLIDVRTPTTFVFRSPNGAGRTLAGTSTTADFGADATVTVSLRNIHWPPSEIVDLCNQGNFDLYLPTPHGATDPCLWNAGDPANSLFGVIFGSGGLSHSRTVHIPYSNEWLFNNAFLQYAWIQQQGNLASQTLITWGVGRAAQVHALAVEAATALGWTGTIKRVMPGNFGIPSDGAAAIAAAVAISAPVDEMEVAPYIGNYPGDPEFGTIFDTLFTQQMFMDLWDEFLIYGTWQGTTAANNANLKAFYPSADLVCYEGGLSDGSLSGSGTAARSRAWARNWRQYRSYTYYLGNILQANGVTLFNHFTLSGQINPPFNFQLYFNCDQADGTGNPSENPTPDDFTTNPVSETGGALRRWAIRAGGGGGGGGSGLGRALQAGWKIWRKMGAGLAALGR